LLRFFPSVPIGDGVKKQFEENCARIQREFFKNSRGIVQEFPAPCEGLSIAPVSLLMYSRYQRLAARRQPLDSHKPLEYVVTTLT